MAHKTRAQAIEKIKQAKSRSALFELAQEIGIETHLPGGVDFYTLRSFMVKVALNKDYAPKHYSDEMAEALELCVAKATLKGPIPEGPIVLGT